MKHLLKMSDLSPAELHHILDVAEELKAEQKAGTTPALLKGRSVALMFSKNSTRTRTSFEVGVYQLGGLGNYMNAATELQSGRGEPLKDTARVLGRYYDCVVWRTYRQRDLEEFAELAGVPVINGLTDYAHPCQVLADLMTIRERRGTLAGRKLCFVGDGSSMATVLPASRGAVPPSFCCALSWSATSRMWVSSPGVRSLIFSRFFMPAPSEPSAPLHPAPRPGPPVPCPHRGR